jgi:hypothetical protein
MCGCGELGECCLHVVVRSIGRTESHLNRRSLERYFSTTLHTHVVFLTSRHRLIVAADAYIKTLTKKTETESSVGKLLPCEALGTIMMEHGEEFGRESVYGTHVRVPGSKQHSFIDRRHLTYCSFNPYP